MKYDGRALQCCTSACWQRAGDQFAGLTKGGGDECRDEQRWVVNAPVSFPSGPVLDCDGMEQRLQCVRADESGSAMILQRQLICCGCDTADRVLTVVSSIGKRPVSVVSGGARWQPYVDGGLMGTVSLVVGVINAACLS